MPPLCQLKVQATLHKILCQCGGGSILHSHDKALVYSVIGWHAETNTSFHEKYQKQLYNPNCASVTRKQ